MYNSTLEPFKPQLQLLIVKLSYFIKNNGPNENEYDELNQLWELLPDKLKEEKCFLLESEITDLFEAGFLEETMQGLAFRKPHGYAGDFEMIDLIYQKQISENSRFRNWDLYFQSQAAPKAVRNRKKYFIDLVTLKIKNLKSPVRILNIASGPCRDILELFEEVGIENLHIQCVEMDQKAIKYSQRLLGRYADKVIIHHKNILRFEIEEQFDLVWSAGLFDYFDDKIFVKLLKKVSLWCAKGGEVVIGNFSENNPSRAYMEKVGEWYLHHRSKTQLEELAKLAGFQEERIFILEEELGVNLFLHISL